MLAKNASSVDMVRIRYRYRMVPYTSVVGRLERFQIQYWQREKPVRVISATSKSTTLLRHGGGAAGGSTFFSRGTATRSKSEASVNAPPKCARTASVNVARNASSFR